MWGINKRQYGSFLGSACSEITDTKEAKTKIQNRFAQKFLPFLRYFSSHYLLRQLCIKGNQRKSFFDK